ncbi:glycosyltransferase family 2 protein [Acinetobacter indicus]|uniref:glycosyltransferase family 2 protein n=1 Tax=Acinetobacter indicus TaxID=756892 RepID=UPI002574EB44|nr:glycosyltransferase family 2 protein [Acinetobacter indicus]MDM1492919.1 glycosyltransferase family 2 protein [Acinetobacter indicus]
MFNYDPLISIGIPFYNAEKYLEFAIQSVIAQSYENWELTLIDDGSSDSSLKIAQEFAQRDGRIRVIYDGQNKKLPSRLNQLIQESKGDFIARMDADDIMHPDRLKIELSFLIENQDYDLVSGGIVSIDHKNNVTGMRTVNKLVTINKDSKSYPIVHPTVMARRDWYLRNLYSSDYPRAEDYELWCRTSSADDLKIAILPNILLFYREFGNIDPNKLINSYNDGYKIRQVFGIDVGLKNFLKIKSKCLIVKLLTMFGLEQNLAKKRNRKFSSLSEKQEYQSIVNNIVNKSLT